MKLKLKIINLEGIYLQKEVDLINIMTSTGNLTIYANHLPLITNVQISHMYLKDHDQIENFAIAGGTLFVSDSECKIITSAIESADEIDLSRAKQAKELAEQRLKESSEDVDMKRAEVALKRAMNRLTLK